MFPSIGLELKIKAGLSDESFRSRCGCCVYMLPVSNMLTILSSQKIEGVTNTCSSWLFYRYSGLSAVGDVYSHMETILLQQQDSKEDGSSSNGP